MLDQVEEGLRPSPICIEISMVSQKFIAKEAVKGAEYYRLKGFGFLLWFAKGCRVVVA